MFEEIRNKYKETKDEINKTANTILKEIETKQHLDKSKAKVAYARSGSGGSKDDIDFYIDNSYKAQEDAVIKAKEEYNAVTAPQEELLDKISLSRKLLSFAEETIIFNGEIRYAAEGKDRLAAYKLYADIQGFIAKDSISTTINNSPKFMEIKFVEPDKKEVVKTIEHESKIEHVLENSPIKLKLVG